MFPQDEINQAVKECHELSKAAGWWDGVNLHRDTLVVPTKIALIHSELSEMLEGDRKGIQDDHLPHLTMFEVEAADVAIRLFDLCGAKGVDLGQAIAEKLEYNRHRLDHKREERVKAGGKTY